MPPLVPNLLINAMKFINDISQDVTTTSTPTPETTIQQTVQGNAKHFHVFQEVDSDGLSTRLHRKQYIN